MLTEGFGAGSFCSLRAAIGLQTSHRLLRLVSVICVRGGFGLSCLLRSFFLAGRLPLLLSRDGLDLARIVDEFDDRQLRRIAVAMAQLQDARVTAGAILVTLAELVEQPSQRGHTRGSFRTKLSAPAGERSHGHVAGVKEAGRLPAQVQRARIAVFKTASAPR